MAILLFRGSFFFIGFVALMRGERVWVVETWPRNEVEAGVGLGTEGQCSSEPPLAPGRDFIL